MFAGRLGAVDARLIDEGLLRPLGSADDLVLERRPTRPARRRTNRDPALLLDLVLSTLG